MPLVNERQKYNPLCKPNQLIYGEGQTAIVTGWTMKHLVANKLDKSEYAVIGQLYSPTRGLSLLIRNLLFNPYVRFLVILDATKEDNIAGGCCCLFDFLRYGFDKGISEDTGRECWIVRSRVTGYIDIEIDKTTLNRLRESIEWKNATSLKEAIAQVKSFAQRETPKPWGIPQQFPVHQAKHLAFPGVRYGHRIEGKTIAETWVKIIHRIKTTGTVRPTGYDGKWQELIDLSAIVTDEPEDCFFPEPNYLPIDRSFLGEYRTQILDDRPVQEGVKYTYGQRLRSWFGKDQIEQVINKLIGEIDAASAVMTLWDVLDHEKGGSPCLNHIWVRVVEDELSLTAVFRSNDMFAAWPVNAMGLRLLQQYIKDEINARSDYNLRLGPLVTLSQSAHIYDDTWESADRLIATQYAQLCKKRDYDDPCGNFVIEVQGNEIVVIHTTPGAGEVLREYRETSPLALVRSICRDMPGIQPEHIGYLGMEFQKASECARTEQSYVQDIQSKKKDVSAKRPTWDEYFMAIARLAASRSTCLGVSVGATIVRNKQLISMGYNGAPSGSPHCTEQGFCYPGVATCTESGKSSRAIHAEVNAIAQATKLGLSTEGATIYTTLEPCLPCLKLIIATGVTEVVYESPGKEDEAKKLLVAESAIVFRRIELGADTMQKLVAAF